MGLRAFVHYPRLLAVAAFILVVMMVYAAGFRGIGVVFIAGLAWWPVYLATLFVSARLFGPRFEPTEDLRSILYGNAEDSPIPARPEQLEKPFVNDDEPALGNVPNLMLTRRESWTFEGAVLAFSAIVLVVWMASVALNAIAYTLFPEWDAERIGPEVFPIRVHIGEQTIAFTNGSDVDWTCEATIGEPKSRATFALESRRTRAIPYRQFTRPTDVSVSRLPGMARVSLTVQCAETRPPGLTHYWIF